MSEELLTELRHKKEVYKRWKQGQVTQEYTFAVSSCRDRVRKANMDTELNPARNVNRNRKGFYKYISRKRKD